MTTKTYFMRSFNLILYLLLIAPICYVFGWLFNLVSVQLSTVTFVNLDTVKNVTDTISSVCYGFALISLLLALLSGLKMIQRLNTDSLGAVACVKQKPDSPFFIFLSIMTYWGYYDNES